MGEYMHKEKSRLRWGAEKLSNSLTRLIGAHYGEVWPQYYVSEFPRSGGTWLANMLSDYLGCACPGPSIFPIGCRAVVHNHWKFHPKLKRVVYLIRDGRDVAVSMYFYRLRAVRNPGRSGHLLNQRIFRDVLGAGYDPEDTLRNLPKIMAYDYDHSVGAGKTNWARHVEMWYGEGRRPNVHYVTYEALIEDTKGELTGCLRHLTGEEPDPRLVERSVEHYSMASVTGRKQGEEDRGSFVRKGVAGDWRNHFTREAAELFNRLGGKALVKAGYEADEGWVDRYEYPAPDRAVAAQAAS